MRGYISEIVSQNKSKMDIFQRNRLLYGDADRFHQQSIKNSSLKLNVLVVLFEDIDALEQSKIIYNTDILISSHGAALMYGSLMSPQSIVVELVTNECQELNNNWIDKECPNLHGWSLYAEISQWRHIHHICMSLKKKSDTQNIHTNDEAIARKKYLQSKPESDFWINSGIYNDSSLMDKHWKDAPHWISNKTLEQLQYRLWHQKFAAVIKTDERLWCRDSCKKYQMIQNYCQETIAKHKRLINE
eukprot:164835_1